MKPAPVLVLLPANTAALGAPFAPSWREPFEPVPIIGNI